MIYGLIAFAVVFMLVGILRVVEIRASGISRKWQLILIPLHVIGCVFFAAAIVLVGLDTTGELKFLTSVCFFIGVAILFPMHIFLALKRRIRMSK